jgi:DNA-directed RNA polymerase subunit RPC12/RpoP
MFPLFSIFKTLGDWLKYSRCPKCGKWFHMEFHSFVNITDRVVGRSRTRYGGGRRAGWQGGGFGNVFRTDDDPFIREWGEARYICRACGRHVSFHNATRDR